MKPGLIRRIIPLLGLVPAIALAGGRSSATNYALCAATVVCFLMVDPGKVRHGFLLAICLGCLAGLGKHVDPYLIPGVPGRTVIAFVNVIQDITYMVGVALFPAFVSYTARRHYFWCGLLTLAVFAFVGTVDYTDFLHIQPSRALFMVREFAVLPLIALVAVAPMSLVRYIVERRLGSANLQQNVAPVGRAAREGAWPPPPSVKEE